MKDIFSTIKLSTKQKMKFLALAVDAIQTQLAYGEKPVLSKVYKNMINLITEDKK